MGWRVGSNIFIGAGQQVRVTFWWGRPGDHGPQWAMGHPLPGSLAALATERVAKTAACSIGRVTTNTETHYSCGDTSTAFWQYYADITNDGPNACTFQLEGGGV